MKTIKEVKLFQYSISRYACISFSILFTFNFIQILYKLRCIKSKFVINFFHSYQKNYNANLKVSLRARKVMERKNGKEDVKKRRMVNGTI